MGPAGWLEREPFRVLDGADDEEDATAWGPIPLREAGKSIDHSRAYVVLWCQYRKGTQQKHWFSQRALVFVSSTTITIPIGQSS